MVKSFPEIDDAPGRSATVSAVERQSTSDDRSLPLAADAHNSAFIWPPRHLIPAPLHDPQLRNNGHRNFNVLLMDMLARFDNCRPEHVESELETAFRRVCEFLKIDRAGCWLRSGHDSESLTLRFFYPAFESLPVTSGKSDPPDYEPPCIRPGVLLHTCFPWIGDQVLRGNTIVLSNLTQLPAGAARDMMALMRLAARSTAIIPALADGKVLGAVSFIFGKEDAAALEWLIERLKFVTQVLAGALLRKAREDERKLTEEALTRSSAEIRQLKEQLQAETDYLRTEIKVSRAHGEIIGRSQVIRRVLHQVEQVAPTECPVLLSGETGTGKELIAQDIHRLSARKERVMVLVNCAALPVALVESELFGRERGAYTGASTSQLGRFEVANGSTIFLDEVEELSMEVQAKLLRVLQQGEFQRLGNPKTHNVNVRVIAAANRDLAADVRKGRFREDLYYRLKVFPIEIPPLRERTGDIPLLVFAFMEEFSSRMGKKITKVPRKAMEALQAYSWPGNIRELRNVIEHSVILSSGDSLKLSVFANSPTRNAQPVTLAEAEREHILKTLESTGWRIKGPHGAAVRLALQPSTLYSQMQKLGIPHRRQKDEMSKVG